MNIYETFASMPVEDQRMLVYGLIFIGFLLCISILIDMFCSFISICKLKKRYKKLGKISNDDSILYFEILLKSMKYDKIPDDYRAGAINTALEALQDKSYRENLTQNLKGSDKK